MRHRSTSTWARLTMKGLGAALLAGVALALAPAPAAAQGEVVEYYATDAVGSTRVVFDAAGNVKAQSDYLPFGEALAATGNLPPQRFTGQERDGEAGLDNFNARGLATRVGRFGQIDPAGGALSNPQTWNRYAYVVNNPLAYNDPTGENAAVTFYTSVTVRSPQDQMWWYFGYDDIGGGGGGSGDGGYGGGVGVAVQAPSSLPGVAGTPSQTPAVPTTETTPPSEAPPPPGDEPCHMMAQTAQRTAIVSGSSLSNFDHLFSQEYVGLPMTSVYNSARLAFDWAPPPRIPRSFQGQGDFRHRFQQEGQGARNDQTHHFAAYLSAGINDAWLASTVHTLAEKSQGDALLGAAGYAIGQRLRRNPSSLTTIGQTIMVEICESK